MGRRRVRPSDRNGDPLDGLVNLWDVALVLAVGLLLAALAGIGLTGILTANDLFVVTDPGEPGARVIARQDGKITVYGVADGGSTEGGTLLGQFYRLADGSIVYVPSGATPPTGVAAPVSTAAPTPTPEGTTGPYPTPTPTVFTPAPDQGTYPDPAATSPAPPQPARTGPPGKPGGKGAD